MSGVENFRCILRKVIVEVTKNNICSQVFTINLQGEWLKGIYEILCAESLKHHNKKEESEP